MIKLKSKTIREENIDVKVRGKDETIEEIIAGIFGLLETIENQFDKHNLDSVIEIINEHFRSDKNE